MLFSLTFTAFLLMACVTDLKAFRIPNVVPLALMALFLIKVAATTGVEVWPSHVAAFGIMLAIGFLAFSCGLIGGGDAKLMAAVALWSGLEALPSFLVVTAIGGGVFALVLVALRHFVARDRMEAAPVGSASRLQLLDRRAPVPYAVAITVAALWLELQ